MCAVLCQVYRPPVGEFEIQSINIPADAQEVCVPANEGPMILLVQHGTGAAKAKASIKDDMLQDQMDLHAGMCICQWLFPFCVVMLCMRACKQRLCVSRLQPQYGIPVTELALALASQHAVVLYVQCANGYAYWVAQFADWCLNLFVLWLL